MKLICVCAGNTCRSPMAQALLQREMPEAKVDSCGLFAHPGSPASFYAARVMAEMGIDLSGHRAKAFTPEMARGALLLPMTLSQASGLKKICPGASIRRFLAEEDVPDPFAGDLETYRRVARMLLRGAKELAGELRRG